MYIKVNIKGKIVDLFENKPNGIYHVIDNIYADAYEHLYFYANGNSVNRYYSNNQIYRVGDLEVGHYYQEGNLSRVGSHDISYYINGTMSHLGPHKITYLYHNPEHILYVGSIEFHRDYYGKLIYIGGNRVY